MGKERRVEERWGDLREERGQEGEGQEVKWKKRLEERRQRGGETEADGGENMMQEEVKGEEEEGKTRKIIYKQTDGRSVWGELITLRPVNQSQSVRSDPAHDELQFSQ